MFRTLKPHQLAIDITIPALCFLLALVLGLHASSGMASFLIVLGMATALVFRRISPPVALAIAWVTAFVQMLSGSVPEVSNLAILPVLFATAAYGSRLVKWLGFASTFVGAFAIAVYMVTLPAIRDYYFGGLLPAAGQNLLSSGQILPLIVNTSFAFVAALAVFMLSWVLGILGKTFSSARESRRAQAKAEMQQLRAQQDVMVEQERTRIARDMHDVVAHSLAVVIAQADGARYTRATDPAAVDDALLTISTTAREALGDVRILLAQLRHSQVEGPQPVLDDLGPLLDQFRGSGLDVRYDVVGAAGSLGTGQQLAVYRIVQEALTNALRHGDNSAEVQVVLRWTPDAVELSIRSALHSDVPIPLRPGHGLAGMGERAAIVGGRLTAASVDRSFVVTASIPRVPGHTGVLPAIDLETVR